MPSCPKCASIHLLPVNGQRVMPPGALPPSRKHTIAWALVAFVFALAAILIENESRGFEAVLLIVTIGGTAAAQRAHLYNVRELPVRRHEYQKKMICARCGEVLEG